MPIETPKLDPRDEDDVVADVIDDLPAELSDRNPSSPAVKLIEGIGTFYGLALKHLNQLPVALNIAFLKLLEIDPLPATHATATVEFTSVDAAGRDIADETVVKNGTGIDAQKFTTDYAIDAASGYVDAGGTAHAWSGDPATISVSATAVVAGEDGNVGADTLTKLESPIAGIDSVTNPASASGGQDEEALQAYLERGPQVIRTGGGRAVTDEDFEVLSIEEGGVARALCVGSAGAVAMYVLATDLNEAPSATLTDGLEDKLEAATIPGVEVTAHQPTIRLVQITEIEVVFEGGADVTQVTDDVEFALSRYITAVDIYEGGLRVADGWGWGESLWANEVVSIVDAVEGVRRVGGIKYRYSDDYGSTAWEAETDAFPLPAAEDGTANDVFGMLHWGTGYPNAPMLTLTSI